MKDYDYSDDLAGLESYLAEFGVLSAAKAPAKASPVKKPVPAKAPAKTPAKAPAKPAPVKKATPTKVAAKTPAERGLMKISVKRAQEIANLFGAKIKEDGLFGPGTAKAWANAAKTKKLDGSFERATGTEAYVHSLTFATLSAGPSKPVAKAPVAAKATASAASKTPVVSKTAASVSTKSVEPSKEGLTKTTVKNAQDILNRLGAKIKADGLFGPTTQKAWATAANAKKLDATFDRASSKEVWVNPETLTSLSSTLPAAKSTPSLATKAAAKPAASLASKAAQKPTEPSKSGLTKIGIGAAQDILNKLGAKMKRDGLFGPGTAKAWATAAKARKVDPVFDRAGPMEAWVDPSALNALSVKAGVSPQATAAEEAAPASAEPTALAPPAPTPAPAAEELAAQKVVEQANTAVPVLMVQQAQLMANKTPAQAGKYIGVEETGSWDDPTERGFFILFGIKPPYDGVWRLALPSLVSDTSVRLLPKQASEVQALAKLWLDNQAKEEAAQQSQSAPEPEPAAETPITDQPQADTQKVSEVVRRSTVLVPVKVLQQALRQLFDLQQAGQIPAEPRIPLPQITGYWRQGSDDVGLILGWGDKLYPYSGIVPTEDKMAILSQIIFSSPGLSGLRGFRGFRALQGLRGFGDVPEGNAIKLPPEIVANIQSLASDYVAKTAASQPQSDSSQVLLPTGGGQVALEPELITGRVPTIEQPQQTFTPAPMPYQDQVQAPAPISLTPNFPDVTNNSYFTPAPAPVAAPAVAPTYEPAVPTVQQPSTTNITVPVATNLTLQPPVEPQEPVQASAAPSSNMGLILGMLGVGAIAVLALKGKDDKKYAPVRRKVRRRK